MPVFAYKAYNIHGKVYKSHLESDTLEIAKSKLLELNIPFVSIQEKKKFKNKKFKKEVLLLFCEQLFQLINANLPLYESLELLKEQFQGDAFFNVLDKLTRSIKAGLSFSDALKKSPQIFNPFFCALIQIGEESGHLEQALQRLCIEIKRELKIIRQIQSALLYPSILMGFCFVLMGLLIFYIVPSIESLLETASSNLFTQSVISVCHHLRNFGLIYISLFLSTMIAMRSIFFLPKYKQKMDHFLLKIPLLKNLLKEISFARWTSTMAMLLIAKVPLTDAMKLSSSLLKNLVLKNALLECEAKVKEGTSLSSELKKNNLFSKILIHLIYIGESSGELSHSFDRLAILYEESVDKKMKKLLTLLSPIILVTMAIFIGIIMLAILIPLTDINSFSL